MKPVNQRFKKSVIALFLLHFAFSTQAQTLSGIIKNADHKPLAGVSIKIPGTKTYVTSNSEGKFLLTADTETITLEIAKEGFNTELILLGKQIQKVEVLLLPDLASVMDKKIDKKKSRKHPLLRR